MKTTITEYTESDFLNLVVDICKVNVSSEKEHSNLVMHFCNITEHPDGSDLIYYPEKPEDDTPENIVKIVKEWRLAQGLPCFKDS
ncbi:MULTISPECIES: bacteriocin immunity protein [Vibrio]|uniref:bacteriocin immunity protein n=1 Tax=Vibrio TaxID=662 RepID=UPI00104AF35A|nr:MULTISPECIES: bacteriocin immunity protein [Vibrio]MCY9829487.1 bacteriocin immunity protein [Vibrio chagasii]TCT58863.1 colicin immunity protein/pyocin immunity protein [Vibrio crassostreae]